MVAKGNPIVTFRISAEELAELDATIERVNETRAGEPYDRGSWIRKCLADKMDHLARSRRCGRRGKKEGGEG